MGDDGEEGARGQGGRGPPVRGSGERRNGVL